MQKINFESIDGVFSGQITLRVKNNAILTKIMNRLKKINGIDKVSRE